MEKAFLHLLIIILAFSHLMFVSNSAPSTRIQELVNEVRDLPKLGDASQIYEEDAAAMEEEAMKNVRMDFESNDYPGSGANDRHTPKPPP